MPQAAAVFSSGAKSPHFAPASTAMFAMVIREATLICSTVSPVNSSDLYDAPDAVSFPLISILTADGTRTQSSPVPRSAAISV